MGIEKAIKNIGLKLYYWIRKILVLTNNSNTIQKILIFDFSILLFLIVREIYLKTYFNNHYNFFLVSIALVFTSKYLFISKPISLGSIFIIIKRKTVIISMEYDNSFSKIKDEDVKDFIIGKSLFKDIKKLYGHELLNKCEGKSFYIKTHENLARRFIKLIAKKKGISIEENEWEKIVENEGLLINGIGIKIKKLKNQTNGIYNVKYSWNASIKEIEDALGKLPHYKIYIPSQLFQIESKE